MKWVTIKKTAVNMDNVDAFKWEEGQLYVFFNSEDSPTEWEDPNADLYRKLCREMEVLPVVEREIYD